LQHKQPWEVGGPQSRDSNVRRSAPKAFHVPSPLQSQAGCNCMFLEMCSSPAPHWSNGKTIVTISHHPKAELALVQATDLQFLIQSEAFETDLVQRTRSTDWFTPSRWTCILLSGPR
jgi:hypothetical protein